MTSQDFRNSGNNGDSPNGNTSGNNNDENTTNNINNNNEINLSNLNLINNNNEATVENNLRDAVSSDTIIGIIANRIDRGYRGTYLVVQLRHSIDSRYFITPKVIRRQQF